MVSNKYDDTGKWLRAVNEFEHDDPEHAPTYQQKPAVIPDKDTAADIGLSSIYRMTAEQVDEVLREFQRVTA